MIQGAGLRAWVGITKRRTLEAGQVHTGAQSHARKLNVLGFRAIAAEAEEVAIVLQRLLI